MNIETKERLDKLIVERDKLDEQIRAISDLEREEKNKQFDGKFWKREESYYGEESDSWICYGQTFINPKYSFLACNRFSLHGVFGEPNSELEIKTDPYFHPQFWTEISKEEFMEAWRKVVTINVIKLHKSLGGVQL